MKNCVSVRSVVKVLVKAQFLLNIREITMGRSRMRAVIVVKLQ